MNNSCCVIGKAPPRYRTIVSCGFISKQKEGDRTETKWS